jgi:hypothetical protein
LENIETPFPKGDGFSCFRGGKMRKYLIPAICLSLLAFSSPAKAETKTFIKEYTYQASDFDSRISSRTIALEQVKRLLLEELGTYLEGSTEVKNFQLTKDKIVALTAGIVQTQIVEEKWDGKTYWLRAEVKADPENIAKSIDALRKDQKKAEGLEEAKKKSDDALKEVEKLRGEIKELKDDIRAREKYLQSVEALSPKSSSAQEEPSKAKQGPKSKQSVSSSRSSPEGKYVASKKSSKYHFPSCKWAQKVSPSNRVVFKSVKDAVNAGYIPCKVCKPPLTD